MYPRAFSPLCKQCIPAPPSTLVMPVHWHHKASILAPLKNPSHRTLQRRNRQQGVAHVFSTVSTDKGSGNNPCWHRALSSRHSWMTNTRVKTAAPNFWYVHRC